MVPTLAGRKEKNFVTIVPTLQTCMAAYWSYLKFTIQVCTIDIDCDKRSQSKRKGPSTKICIQKYRNRHSEVPK
jgi:hypothetical protein